jgi:phage terminase large subunit
MSFNPILQTHWIFEEYFKSVGWADTQTEYHGEGLSILKTTYKDNRFLTKEDIAGLEGEKDKYFRDVYTLGNWGVLGHVIFTNWRVEDLSSMAGQFTNPRNGLDFGYSSDPAALWVSHYDAAHRTLYVYDELYETGLLNDVLSERVKGKIGAQIVVCDSAEPKSIAELQMRGISTWPAVKGKDSVLFGIQWLQQQTIVVDAECVNTQNELRQYHWKEDAGGRQLPIPVDRNNHLIDAARYALESDMIPVEEDYHGTVELSDRVEISAF